MPSLGYLFGDEGAGSYLGKMFIECYLKKKLPDEIADAFDQKYHLSLENILDALYNKPSPNRFLASFSEFIEPRKQDPFIHELLLSSYNAFFHEHIMKYDNFNKVQVSFVGKIAFYYQEILMSERLCNPRWKGSFCFTGMARGEKVDDGE